MSTLNERLDELKTKIQTTEFLKGIGLSNEVNIGMFCYEPEDEMTVRYFISQLQKGQDLKCKPIIFNLFHVLMTLCEKDGILEELPEFEKDDGKEDVLETLKNTGDNELMVAEMKEQFQDNPGDLIIFTGVGEVFPFVRVHSVLESMQKTFGNIPIVVFYPGKFNGLTVRLFNRLEANQYYRAFNLC